MPLYTKPSKKKIRTAGQRRHTMFKHNPSVRVRFSDQITRERKVREANRISKHRHLKGQAEAKRLMLERQRISAVRFPKEPFPTVEEIQFQGQQKSILGRAFSRWPDDIFYSSSEEDVPNEQPFAARADPNSSLPALIPNELPPSVQNENPVSLLDNQPIPHNQRNSSAPLDGKLSTLQKIVELFAGQKRRPKAVNDTQRKSSSVREIPAPKAPVPGPENEGIRQNVSEISLLSEPRRILTAGDCTIIDSLPLNDPYFQRCKLIREPPAPGHKTVGIVPEMRRCNRRATFVLQCSESFITSYAPLLPYARTRTYETVFDRRKDLWPKWARQSEWPRRYI